MEENGIFKGEFIPYIVKWGRLTDLLGAVLVFSPCIYMAINGILPEATAFVAALAIQLPSTCTAWIREPISYFTMLGVPGTYMAFLSGNISNLRVPCSSIATKSAGLEEGTDQGTITATLGCATSTFVSTIFLTIGVLAGNTLLQALPPIVTSALNLLLPALFASLLCNYCFMKPKLAAICAPAAFFVYWLQLQGVFAWAGLFASAIPPLICSFGSMGLGVVLSKKEAAKA